jgi:hypothetical protein
MCPACIASAAAMVAGAGSSGGILAVCISKFRGNKMATTHRSSGPGSRLDAPTTSAPPVIDARRLPFGVH